jgi:hypothetical protein
MPDSVNPISLGTCVMTLLDPKRGAEVSFNRYYERERFYAAMMLGPSAFSGGRFIARRSDKAARRVLDASVDPERGSFLNLFWVIGSGEDLREWTAAQVEKLDAAGRTNWDRVPYWGYRSSFEWSVSRDADGVPPELALVHRYRGLALAVIKARDGADVREVSRWYRENVAPSTVRPDGSAALCLGCVGSRLSTPVNRGDPRTGQVSEEKDLLLFWFLEWEPEQGWPELVAAHEAGFAGSTDGVPYWMSRFIPSNPGTDDYVEDIWLSSPSDA